MWFTLLFILSTLFERLINIEIGLLRLGPGDIIVLFALPYCYYRYGSIPIFFVALSVASFFIIFISIIINKVDFGYNALITVPLRFITAGVISNELLSLRKYSPSIIACFLLYAVMFICALFFSDGSSVALFQWFNRNELLCYSVVCILLCLYCFSFRDNIKKKLEITHTFLFLWLLFVALLFQSRQNVVALIFGFLFLFLSFRPNEKILIIFGLIILCSVLAPWVVNKINEDERLFARLATVTAFDPATRADKYRLGNVIQAVNGYLKSPVFGNGPTSFRRDNRYNKVAHSTPFSIMYELGSFGILFLMFIFYYIVRVAFGVRNKIRPCSSMLLLTALLPVIVLQSFFIELLSKAPIYVYISVSYAVMKKICISENYYKEEKVPI